MPNWLIGIPTYRRPQLLRAALESLRKQVGAPSFTVLVVDNDPAGSARCVVEEYLDSVEIQYAQESRPGVVHVRNRILAHARDFNNLVFLDDDETASEDWLFELERASATYPRSVIAGPVRYVLEPGTEWSGLHEISFGGSRRAQGALMETAGTANSLIPMAVLKENLESIAFDDRFSFIGGEDTVFFSQLRRGGVEIRWWPHALVYESVPLARSTKRAVRDRIYRRGYVSALHRLENQTRAKAIAGAVLRVLVGLFSSIFGYNSSARARGRSRYLAGRGAMSAVLGRELRYYGGLDGHADD